MQYPTDTVVDEIIRQELCLDDGRALDRNASLTDLGADSLDHVTMVMTIEERLDIRISDDDAENAKTVGDLYDLAAKARTPAPAHPGAPSAKADTEESRDPEQGAAA